MTVPMAHNYAALVIYYMSHTGFNCKAVGL